MLQAVLEYDLWPHGGGSRVPPKLGHRCSACEIPRDKIQCYGPSNYASNRQGNSLLGTGNLQLEALGT